MLVKDTYNTHGILANVHINIGKIICGVAENRKTQDKQQKLSKSVAITCILLHNPEF